MMTVASAPISTNRKTPAHPSTAKRARSKAPSKPLKPAFIRSMPRNTRPMPSSARPPPRQPASSRRARKTPKASIGIDSCAMLSLRPASAISQAPEVVPRLAPSVRPTPPRVLIRPALRKAIPSRVTRVLDCTAAVLTMPTSRLFHRPLVLHLSQRSSAPPEKARKPSSSRPIPMTKRPTPAARVANSVLQIINPSNNSSRAGNQFRLIDLSITAPTAYRRAPTTALPGARSAALQILVALLATVTGLGATQAAHEGFPTGTHDQLLTGLGGIAGQRGERQTHDKCSGTYCCDGRADRAGNDQVTHHGKDVRILDVFLITVIGLGGHDTTGEQHAGEQSSDVT